MVVAIRAGRGEHDLVAGVELVAVQRQKDLEPRRSCGSYAPQDCLSGRTFHAVASAEMTGSAHCPLTCSTTKYA